MQDENNVHGQKNIAPERVLLVGVDFGRTTDFEEAVGECRQLVLAANGQVVETVTCRRARADAAYFVGKGKAEEIATLVDEQEIDLVIFNHNLSPSQERNLELLVQCRVLDRVGLILAIFALRARSQEGQLQVELAQLVHLSSRLVRGYKHMQSQKGGIGLKGPGETQLETDRRLIISKISALKKRLAKVQKNRETQRRRRQKNSIKTVALVGYTNAGKSSLFKKLTKADVLVKDQLFATLDSTSRKLYLSPECQVILADTVGFVRDLPHTLIDAFSATLEEAALADLLLHVVDISSDYYEDQIEEVNRVLTEIGAHEIPQLLVFNKVDLMADSASYQNEADNPISPVYLSALTGEGLDVLRPKLVALLSSSLTEELL